jgi:hypothetical protein
MASFLFFCLSSSASSSSSPSFPLRYFVNILFDCTIGIILNLLILRGFEGLFFRNGINMQSGDYGTPAEFSRFFTQCVTFTPATCHVGPSLS